MSNITEVTELGMSGLEPYTESSEQELKKDGLFIAESPKVIRIALDAGYEPVSVLTLEKYVHGQGEDIIERCGSIPVYAAPQAVMCRLTGHKLTQGMLCLMKRRALAEPDEVLAHASRVAVLESITNQTNVGAIFRSAAALGFDGVLLDPTCSDPLLRRSVRVSMGSVFMLPWAWFHCGSPDYVGILREKGFAAAAMALHGNTVGIDDKKLASEDRLAVIFGTEGEGLKAATVEACDYTVKIPMSKGVDSLNVAAASAVAFWQLSHR